MDRNIDTRGEVYREADSQIERDVGILMYRKMDKRWKNREREKFEGR